MYKIIKHIDSNIDLLYRKSDNTWIPRDTGNRDYQQFIIDVIGIGITCVEGSTVGVTTAYDIARKAEYPPIEDQLDKIYHSGVNAWKADIKAIKDKYPKTQVGVTTVAAVPSWIQTDVDEKRKNDYLTALRRLEEPRLKSGVPYEENVWDPDKEAYVTQVKYTSAPDPNNSDVIEDEQERNDAEAILAATPQSIIDSINT